MTLIPETTKEQFLFFFDNPLVAAEPGGNALIAGFLELVAPLLERSGQGGDSASVGAWFDPGLSFAAPEGSSADASGKTGGGDHGGDGQADAALGAIVGLVAGLARGDLDI